MIRIAIVEDDQSADDQLTACLEKLSLQSKEVFDLSHYPDAQQFLFAFHSQFDLIFMDIEMPNMDGLSAARRMREIDSNVALVFVTNLARYAINGYEVSALDYILKPLDYDAFYLKMQKVLRYCQTQQQRRQQDGQESFFQLDLPLPCACSAHIWFHYSSFPQKSKMYSGNILSFRQVLPCPRRKNIFSVDSAFLPENRQFSRFRCCSFSKTPV